MPRLPEKLLLLLLLTAVAVGCKPKIGDDCQISTDCSAAGDRLCDITAPGGYCTVYNCEPGACPEDESLCVQFGAQRSPIDACFDEQSPSPYARTFCMATCDENSDCRDGYKCATLTAGNDWNAILIDTDRGNKACMVPASKKLVSNVDANGNLIDGFGDVCHAEVPAPQPPSGSAGSGGTPSAGGMSGAAGESGSGGASGAGGQDDGAAGAALGGAADGGAGG